MRTMAIPENGLLCSMPVWCLVRLFNCKSGCDSAVCIPVPVAVIYIAVRIYYGAIQIVLLLLLLAISGNTCY